MNSQTKALIFTTDDAQFSAEIGNFQQKAAENCTRQRGGKTTENCEIPTGAGKA